MRGLQLRLPWGRARPAPRADGAEALPFVLPLEPEGPGSAGAEPPPERSEPPPGKEELLLRARELADHLSRDLGRPVRLSVHDNRSTMLSFRGRPDVLCLRLHHMFLAAPAPVVHAVADYAGRNRRGAAAVIDRFVRAQGAKIRPGSAGARAQRLVALGCVHDLQAMFDRLNAVHFDGRILARIGWGRAAGGRRRRTIRMGVYDHLARAIRVHPSLDRPEVPPFFVEYIVFHEMLHQAVPGADHGVRRQHHGREFKARERAYPGFDRALAWERAHIDLLLGKSGPRSAAAAVLRELNRIF